jgi:hypothetical protein
LVAKDGKYELLDKPDVSLIHQNPGRTYDVWGAIFYRLITSLFDVLSGGDAKEDFRLQSSRRQLKQWGLP